MLDWFLDAADHLSGSPVMQGVLAAMCTFMLEDPTTVGAGLLVADGRMKFATAMIGLSSGIALGDSALYAAGRWMAPSLVNWGLLSRDRLEKGKHWFARNLISAVLISRFVPGMRLPAYAAAGVLHAPLGRFLALVVFGSLLWTFLLLSVTIKIGQAALPWLGAFKWPLAIALLAGWMVLQRYSAQWITAEDDDADSSKVPTTSYFEFWPPAVFYAPVAVYYALLAIWYRSLSLPTAVNPSIYSGGTIMESKSAILDLVPESHQQWLPKHTTFDRTSESIEAFTERAVATLDAAGIVYPFVAKPDEGRRGDGVQIVRNEEELTAYLAAFPAGLRIVFQDLVDDPLEAGVLYYRYPTSDSGVVFSITARAFPAVTGDGDHTLRELILEDERAYFFQDVYLKRHQADADRVLLAGERYPLVFAGSHRQGAMFLNACDRITPELTARFDEIAKAIPDFYFGRFDVRYSDEEAFAKGEGFHIIEINGAGSEATHIWDARTKLRVAYRTLFKQFRILFKIGAANRRTGTKPIGSIQFLRDFRTYLRQAKTYPGGH
jgi:membrane protein DedA with SNARE-associated domain